MDHIWIGYHHEAVDALWPLRSDGPADGSWRDHECWWTSQWVQSMEAAMMFKGHVHIVNTTVVWNGGHTYIGEVKKWTHWMATLNRATDWLRSSLDGLAAKGC